MGRILRERRPEVLQLGFLLIARERDGPTTIDDNALFERGVIQPATQTKDTPQFPLLRGSGHKFVLECLAHGWLVHCSLFCLTGVKTATEQDRTGPVLSPCLKAGACAPKKYGQEERPGAISMLLLEQ